MIDVAKLWKVFGANKKTLFQDGLPPAEHAAAYAETLCEQGQTVALQNLNLTVKSNKRLVLFGETGAGKTTLLRLILRLICPSAGSIAIGGAQLSDVGEARLRKMRQCEFAALFERPGLFPHLSVADNVQFALKIRGDVGASGRKSVETLMEQLDIAHLSMLPPQQLSAKHAVLTALARALAGGGFCWLFDNPLSRLEQTERAQLQDIIVDLQARRASTMLFATDCIDEAFAIGDTIAILRDGALLQVGSREEILAAPANPYIAARTRHLTATINASIDRMVEPVAALPTADGPILRLGMSIDEATRLSAASIDRLRVADGAGRIVGSLRTSRLTDQTGTGAAAIRRSA